MIKGVKLNKKGEAVLYLDVFPQTDELKDAVKELPTSPPRPGFKSHSMGLEITETITIEPGKYDVVMWKGFTKAGNQKMTINFGDHNPKYAQSSDSFAAAPSRSPAKAPEPNQEWDVDDIPL
tara:strand:- start:542 stop:907 length:366 start_codon:yes stop_codon:yes gene_type:complete